MLDLESEPGWGRGAWFVGCGITSGLSLGVRPIAGAPREASSPG